MDCHVYAPYLVPKKDNDDEIFHSIAFFPKLYAEPIGVRVAILVQGIAIHVKLCASCSRRLATSPHSLKSSPGWEGYSIVRAD